MPAWKIKWMISVKMKWKRFEEEEEVFNASQPNARAKTNVS
jgi:hypothetical protein